ncbi:zinc finger domain-containing protein [Brevibacterium sp. p3-SID960]|uniref:zinc finger domain-containing protein n=1 Tax=Brevibacterium sp. p3-SID960 TaxID=2916063 RepID=UPI002882DBAC|nr:zinc finger domain-containing protein [Brevibacterium sp. p3-SID960]
MRVLHASSHREVSSDQRKRHLQRLLVFQCIYRGKSGYFDRSLGVYGRTGQPCLRCGTLITRLVVGGRGTHICLQCQKPQR